MPAIVRQGQRIAYDVHGGGPRAIVFAHDLFTDRRAFEFAAYALSRRMCAINVDLRGHGDSRGVREAFDPRDLGEDLCAVMMQEGIDRAVVVGQSLGAAAAMELALEHPSRVEALALLGATGRAATWRERAIHRALRTLLPVTGFQGQLATAVTHQLFGPTFHVERPDLVREWQTRLQMLDAHDAVLADRAWISRREMLSRAAAIRVPVLVVAGEQDAACPVAESEALVRAMGGTAVLERVARAGHTISVERPDDVLAVLERFLDKLSS
jgi:pimeloyl-ACP methyl ester carboxylesterase